MSDELPVADTEAPPKAPPEPPTSGGSNRRCDSYLYWIYHCELRKGHLGRHQCKGLVQIVRWD